MTSEVTSGLRIKLSDLNTICFHGFLASKCPSEMIVPQRRRRRCRLTCVGSLQVKKMPSYVKEKLMHQIPDAAGSAPKLMPQILVAAANLMPRRYLNLTERHRHRSCPRIHRPPSRSRRLPFYGVIAELLGLHFCPRPLLVVVIR